SPRIGPLTDMASTVAPGTRYVLCVLKPTKDYTLDRVDLDTAMRNLSPSAVSLPAGDYVVVAGVAGPTPARVPGSDFPFAERVNLEGVPVEVRMESWLAADTIRRMGFGHVIAARHHTLIVERGVSFAAFDSSGAPLATEYAAGLFARPR